MITSRNTSRVGRRGGSIRSRNILVFLMTFTAGATDAVGFLALGEAFTSVMTGNIVLFGISVADRDGDMARHIVTAIICYVIGCVLGTRLAGTPEPDQPVWPRHVTRALTVELAIFVAGAILWWSTGSAPHGPTQLALLGADALALGIQGSGVLRFGDSGLSTTYMTGKLTKVVAWIASGGHVRHVARNVGILASLLIGAVVSAFLVRHAPAWVPIVQILPMAVVIGTAVVAVQPQPAHRREGRSGAGRAW